MPIIVTVPSSDWLHSEFTSQIEESFSQESEYKALRDRAEFGERALDSEDFEDLLRDIVDEDAVLDSANVDYVEGFALAASSKAKFEVKLKRRKGDAKGSLTRLIDRKAAIRLVGDESLDEEELASAIEELFESWLETESFKLEILDYVASSTDALMCDRLLNAREFAKRVRQMRVKKHGRPARAPRPKGIRGRLYISGQSELPLIHRPLGKLH